MIPLPKARCFWDYALFALVTTGLFLGLFWVEASDRIGWTDAVLAGSAAVVLVLAIILARQNERAAWINRPSRWVRVASVIGVLLLTLGAVYADQYVLHRKDVTADRFQLHIVILFAVIGTSLFRLRIQKRRGVS